MTSWNICTRKYLHSMYVFDMMGIGSSPCRRSPEEYSEWRVYHKFFLRHLIWCSRSMWGATCHCGASLGFGIGPSGGGGTQTQLTKGEEETFLIKYNNAPHYYHGQGNGGAGWRGGGKKTHKNGVILSVTWPEFLPFLDFWVPWFELYVIISQIFRLDRGENTKMRGGVNLW